jgi:hypothetical protein
MKLQALLDKILKEAFDSSVVYRRDDWGTEDEETGEYIPHPNEIAYFTVEGVDYMWVAKENRYSDTVFEIVFGVDKKETNNRGASMIDIGMTQTGNAMSVFSTVLEITNDFVERFETVRSITFTSKEEEESRTRLYDKLTKGDYIENFELSDKHLIHGEWSYTMNRVR